MDVDRWSLEMVRHVVSQVGPGLSTYAFRAGDERPAVFMTSAPSDVATPFVIVEDPDIDATPVGDGYLEDVTAVVRYYAARQPEAISAANAAMNGLSAYFGAGTQPRALVVGFPLYPDSVSEVESDQPEEYALELTLLQYARA